MASYPAHLSPALASTLRQRALAAVLVAITALLTSCDDTAHITAAVEALKSREKKVVARETAIAKYERQLADIKTQNERTLAEKERQLADSAAALERQRAELESVRKALEEQAAKAERQKAALLERERRGPPPSVSAERVLIINPKNNEILLEKNADRRGPVASTQKLLTALIVAESGDLDQIVVAKKEDTQCGPVKIGLNEGEEYSRRQLLTALMVKSFNDIARAIARDNAGSIEAFATKMNTRAKLLGMADSHFVNPNGLPADDQYSTARDMAKLAVAVDAVPAIREMISTRTFAFIHQ